MNLRFSMTILLLLAGTAPPVCAFPEFPAYAQKTSGRSVNCAMCHANDNGPYGNDQGQMGSLKEVDLEQVNKARSAMQPGVDVESPIMNEFGNHIIKTLGMEKVLDLRDNPAKLATALGNKSDLDGDGIPDGIEFVEGTDPLNKFQGDPLQLLLNNLARYRVDLVIVAVSTSAVLFGLSQFLKGFQANANKTDLT
jgi:hypothetical protein